MFDKKRYYSLSKDLDYLGVFTMTISCIIFALIGFLLFKVPGIFCGLVLGILVGYFPYLKIQIKVEEMRMMIEIHDNLKELNNKENHELENKIWHIIKSVL